MKSSTQFRDFSSRFTTHALTYLSKNGVNAESIPFSHDLSEGQLTQAWLLRSCSPTKGIVCFIHGTGNDAFYPHLTLFTSIIKAGYHIYTFDLPGHGLDSTSILETTNINDQICLSLENIPSQYKHLDKHLMAHSFGAFLALQQLSLKRLSYHYASASLISAPLNIQTSIRSAVSELSSVTSKSFWRQFKVYGSKHLLPAIGSFKRSSFPIRIKGKHSPLTYIKTVQDFVSTNSKQLNWKEIQTPTLLCYGSFDQIIPLTQGQSLQSHIKNSKLLIINNECHFTTLLSQALERELINWLNQWSLKSDNKNN